jgi:hypothetical protein
MLALKLLTYAPTGAMAAAATVAAGKDRRRSQLRLQVRMDPRYILRA